MNRNHLIERMVFSFGLEDESLYKEFSDSMSQMSKDGLADAIDRVLDEHSTDDVHLVIDRIEIDIGDVRMEDLRETVKARVVNELTARLEALRADGVEAGLRTEDKRSRNERMLEHFVLNGRLPWWAPSSGVRMKEVFQSVMAAPGPASRRLFEKARHNTVHLKRLLGLADVDALVQSWRRVGKDAKGAVSLGSPAFVHEAVRMVAPRFGREKAYEIVKYNLLAEMMGQAPSYSDAPAGQPLSTWLFRESPLSGLSDTNRRYLANTLRPLIRKEAAARGASEETTTGPATPMRAAERLEGKESIGKRRKTGKRDALRDSHSMRGTTPVDPMLADFRSFLVSGRMESFRSQSTTAEVNLLFRRLVGASIRELTDLIVSLGKSLRVRQRLLDNVSSRNIRQFFSEVIPGKRDLLTWLDSVYMETQEKVRPINQTNIRVQRSVDEVTLEILTTTDINAISNEAFLRMHLKRMALKHNIRYRDLLRVMVEAISSSKHLASNRFFDILTALKREVFPESGSAPTRKASAAGGDHLEKADEEDRRTGEGPVSGKFEEDRLRSDLGGDKSEESPKPRYFLRFEGKSRKFRPWVEDASIERLKTPAPESDAGEEKRRKTPASAEPGKDEKSTTGTRPVESRTGRDASKTGSEITGSAADAAYGEARPGDGAFRERDERRRFVEEEYPVRMERRLPLPMELLYRLPKELVRQLISVKRSLLFGKSTKALQDLVSGYLRYVSDPMPYDESVIPELLQRIADHLDVDVEFLRFALERGGTARLTFPAGGLTPQGISAGAGVMDRSVVAGEAADSRDVQDVSADPGISDRTRIVGEAGGSSDMEAASGDAGDADRSVVAGEAGVPRGEVAAKIDAGVAGRQAPAGEGLERLDAGELIRHLTKHRHQYTAYHVRMLLNEVVGKGLMDRPMFESIVRLLFERDAKLVAETVEGILSNSYRVLDAAMRSEVYKAFVAAALAPANAPFDMNGVLSEVRRRVGVDRKEPFVMPARLSDAEMYFSAPLAGEGRKRGKGRSRRSRERGVILFYNILNLDVVLEEAGVNFFENILFSFELLLSRYRSRFLEILQSNAYNAELSQFFAYTDESRLFEQIRQLLPRSRNEEVTSTFAAATDILHRLRWIDLPRDEIRRFAYLDAYPLLFSPTEGMPDVHEVVIGILHRAARAELLRFDALADGSLPSTVADMRRRLGAARFSRLITAEGTQREKDLDDFLEEIRVVRDDTSYPVPKNEAMLVFRLAEAVATEGVFPEDHPFAGQKAEAHLEYLGERIGKGEVLSLLVRKGSTPSVVATVTGWLDREQLMAALAHRFGVPVERFIPVVRGWLGRISARPSEERELMVGLLLAPVPVRPTDRLAVFNRSLLHAAMRDRYLSLGDGLEVLYGDAASVADMRVGLTTDHVVSGLRDESERWPEFYLGVLSSPSIGNRLAYRVIDTWVRYFSRRPEGMTSDGVFRAVVEVYFRNAFWHQRSPRRMHELLLEGTGVLRARTKDAAKRVAADLLTAGVPADLLIEHAAMRQPDILLAVEEAVRERGIAPTSVAASVVGKMASVIGPAELTGFLLGVEDRSGRVPRVLRKWMEDRVWDDRSARRFLAQLPEKAGTRLIGILSGPVDLERVVMRWAAFLKSSGLVTDAREAKDRVYAAVVSGRLWKYTSREFIHADLFRRLDIAGLLRRSKTSVDIGMIRSSALPPALFRRALADEPGGGWEDTDALMEAWLSEAPAPAETPAVRMDDPLRSVTVKGFGRIDADVSLFLETGRVAGQQVPAIGSPEFRSIIERVRAVGVSLFLDMPVLHPRAASMIPTFFSKSEVLEHLFSVIEGGTGDRVLLSLLRETAGRLSKASVSNESIAEFVRLYRRRFPRGVASGSSALDVFLMEALRIREFERASDAAAAGMRTRLSRARGSQFVRHLIDGIREERERPATSFEQVLAEYLDKGRLPDDASQETMRELRQEAMTRMAAGDSLLRTMIQARSGSATSRRRLLQLLGPGAEKRLVNFIHPRLRERLAVFAVLMRRHLNIDVWKAVGVSGETAKLDLVLQWWSDARPRITDPIEIVRLFMEQVADALDRERMERVMKADLSRFSPVEKGLWMQLRALVPAMLDLPSDKDRKIPTKEEADRQAARNEPDEVPNAEEGITVHNGGLVLLWPFIGRLFSRLQLTDGKVFIGEREQARAIQLTEYLVTGKTEMEEYALSLNKVVCGAPLDFPVPPVLDLTPEEEEVCQKLLVGAIRNWEKMKNTRPRTFQETFLRREARLYKLEDRWELTVDRKAYDILLDTLPWNISMFQLNWMPQRMVVHWK